MPWPFSTRLKMNLQSIKNLFTGRVKTHVLTVASIIGIFVICCIFVMFPVLLVLIAFGGCAAIIYHMIYSVVKEFTK